MDYGLQMAYSNFSGALLHVGGSDDTYNVSALSPYAASFFASVLTKLFPAVYS